VGELGLGGEIRAVSHGDRRVREAVKLGFTRVIVPKSNLKDAGRDAIGVRHLRDAIEAVMGDA
jgi:DNA repair protein RadA/Sms